MLNSRLADDVRPRLEPLLVEPREAARILSISPRKLWSISAPRGPLPTVPIGRLVRYSVDDLRDWIARSKTATAAEQPSEGRP